MRSRVMSKGNLYSKYPSDPIVRGSYYRLYRQYNKLRKFKARTFKACILSKLDDLQTDNPKSYWHLINSLKEDDQNDKVKSVDASDWYEYFKDLNTIPNSCKNRLKQLDSQLNGMHNSKNIQ